MSGTHRVAVALIVAATALGAAGSGPAAAVVPEQAAVPHPAAAPPMTAGLAAGFSDQPVVTVPAPTDIAFTPDGRMLVTTQPGVLYVVRAGSLVAAPALDLRARACSNGERGLLGVVADPDPASRFVYVFWTRRSGACPTAVNRVSRFTFGVGSDVLDPASELVLIDGMPTHASNHNGGDLAIGKDGYLYVSVGDGGCNVRQLDLCAGTNTAARDRSLPNGKILRITRTGGVPADNPWTGAGSARCNRGAVTPGTICQEIFAFGLRNPFRIAMDPDAATTSFRINDVGQGAWEEVDQGVKGADYGWNVREGHCQNTGREADCGGAKPAGMTDPVLDYGHSTGCNAITGAAYVPDGVWPATWDDKYLFSDYTCGKIFAAAPGGALTTLVSGLGRGSAVTLQFGPSAAADDAATGQSLYYTTFADGGQVRRLSWAGAGDRAPLAAASATPSSGAAPLAVTLSAAGSSDPDGDALTYSWDFGDGATATTSSTTVAHTFAAGAWTVTLRAEDGDGLRSAPVSLRVTSGDLAPTATITAPGAADRFTVGQTYHLTGTGTDPEDGALAGSALSWTLLLHHDSHTHPFLGPVTGSDVAFTAPVPEDPTATATSYLEIRLSATDSAGVTTTVEQDFRPLTVAVTLTASPTGSQLVVAGQTVTTPTTVTSWAGYHLGLSVPAQPDAQGRQLGPDGWSDGGAVTRTLVTPSSPVSLEARLSLRGLIASLYAGSDPAARPASGGLVSSPYRLWGTGSPGPGIPVDGFSVRWAGQLIAPRTGTWTLRLSVEDGVRMMVAGRVVVDAWNASGPGEFTAAVPLAVNARVPLLVEYRGTSGPARLRLSWSGPGTPAQVVPASALRPRLAVNFQPAGRAVPGGYLADLGRLDAVRGPFGYRFGWQWAADGGAVARGVAADPRYDTFVAPPQQAGSYPTWQLAVAPGTYRVRAAGGDPASSGLVVRAAAEGSTLLNGTTSVGARWVDGWTSTTVSDGLLTITPGVGASGYRLNFVDVTLE